MAKGLAFNLFILLGIFVSACTSIRPRYHEVEPGDTLGTLARQYDVPLASLERHNAEVRSGLKVGQKLYIPFEESPLWNQEHKSDNAESQGDRELTQIAEFSWPVQGPVSSVFGKRVRGHREAFHEGIDIAARHGTPVRAARSGHVIYVGNGVRGYGNLVIVKHPDSFATVYAHLSKFQVKKGQYLRRGDVLGKVGRTGRARGSHLHFEIRDEQTPVDPLAFLPGQLATHSASP